MNSWNQLCTKIHLKNRRRNKLRNIKWGIYYGFPPCCILRWTLFSRSACDHGVILHKRKRHWGRKYTTANKVFVPCGIFHKPTHTINTGEYIQV